LEAKNERKGPRRRWVDYIKVDLKDIWWEGCQSGYGQRAGVVNRVMKHGFRKMSWLAEKLFAYKEGFCCLGLGKSAGRPAYSRKSETTYCFNV
jgi:hypothetical protein